MEELEKEIIDCMGRYQIEHLGKKYCSLIQACDDKGLCTFQLDEMVRVERGDSVFNRYLCKYNRK